MIPFFFGQSYRRIFGLYHPPAANRPVRGAVVLCQPLGTEFINAHRAMRQLAIMLSDAGFHTLRFDYYGTGDSEGESQTITADDLVKDIGLAIDELCSIGDCARVRIVGLRLGASLAAIATALFPDRVEALVLLDPVVSARDHIEEFALDGRSPPMKPARRFPAVEESDALARMSFPMNAAMASQISAMDLAPLAANLPAQTFAVVTADADGVAALQNALADAPGASIPVESFPGFPCWREEWPVVVGAVPFKALTRIVTWMKAVKRRTEGNPSPVVGLPTASNVADDSGAQQDGAATGPVSPSEIQVRIGQAPFSIGILTTPAEPHRAGDKPGIIILNTGIAHRVGHFRISVNMARELASVGHSVLRFDLSGIGDSERRDDGLSPFESVRRDIRDAVDFMQAKCAISNFVLIGNCSGADNALFYAGRDPRVVAAVLIDPSLPLTPRYRLNFLVQRLYSWRAWLRGALKPRRLTNVIRGNFVEHGSQVSEGPNLSDPELHSFLSDCFKAMVKANDKIMLVCTGGIQYRYNYELQIVDAFPEIDFGDKLSIFQLSECDHLFRFTEDRDRLFGVLKEWLASTQLRDAARRDVAYDNAEYF